MNTETNNGVDVEVRYQGGHTETETVRVRKISRAELPRLAEVMVRADADETHEAAFYVGRDFAWANSLTDESFDDVIEAGQKINFHRFENWMARQNRKLAAVNSNPELVRLAKAAGLGIPTKGN